MAVNLMSQLPMELRRLQPVRGALELLTYLSESSSGAADADEIVEDLSMSDRSFNKVIRRLVTTQYIQMRSDYVYELTQKGRNAAQTLAEFEGQGADATGITRQVIIAVPRNLVAGQISPLYIGFAPESSFAQETDVIVQLDGQYLELGDFDEMVKLNRDSAVVETTIAPQEYDQGRLKLHVFQLSAGGDDLNEAGGMYVDIAVLPGGDTGELIAYGAEMSFKTN